MKSSRLAKTGEHVSAKYFINVCGHASVGEPKPTTRLDDSGQEVEGISVPVSIGPERATEDHSVCLCKVSLEQ